MSEKFPQRLRKLRRHRNISQRLLSELCGLSKDMVMLYERGTIQPTLDKAEALANFFDVSLDYLSGRGDR